MASNQPAYAPTPVAEPTGQWHFGEPGERFSPDGPGYRPGAPATPEVPGFQGFPGSAAPLPAPAAVPAPEVPAQTGSPRPGADGLPGDGPRSQPRLPRQRGGLPGLGGGLSSAATVGSAVLGMAAMAAVGTSGVAAAAEPLAAAPPIAAPDLSAAPAAPAAPAAVPGAAPAVPLPDVAVGTPSYDPAAVTRAAAAAPAAERTTEAQDAPCAEPAAESADPGEALCSRIIAQVTQQRADAERRAREAAERIAAEKAAKEAAARKVREQAAAAKAEAEAKAKAAAEAAAQAEAERLAELAASYVKPVASYTLTNAFGESGNMWATHTGQDFAAPTGTPVHAVHTGTVTSAGWAGSYGYRVVLRLDDGTELWYCHLSTMVATDGRVTTGDTIGRVGATGNVPGPHLHLEVRPGGGAPVDPVPWLHGHDVAV
ncbi:M23 family metallopeptidase [Streptomyces sp. NRRL F-5123]|uniref:M23 family metallopeptidase n=1 Tax=Streptomyces sp. NRRL F-5123 TaxID=1463856 RepID=UPI000A691873|nr:M23 family metallopeptidase [Streptomyces sp. NRRL F-5123]